MSIVSQPPRLTNGKIKLKKIIRTDPTEQFQVIYSIWQGWLLVTRSNQFDLVNDLIGCSAILTQPILGRKKASRHFFHCFDA
ncbi:hypothetical protein SBF1_1660023 [Candidatus Desulfosporosinus infrequens]|uniref:Uncharacterized protein n=1 Tax=Candidatus Desulfosporosinus infrequens TaxID=2043169 RepID=A0A2U3KAS8_9FIRM|nr:hypothetical protein SBF1_1660023 [Candidatus Desulfosporosinus infrequens]